MERPWMIRLKEGDEQAFSYFYLEYVKKLHFYIRSVVHSPELTQDLVHDTFVQVWEYRDRLDIDRAFAPYIFTIAKRLLINFLKRAQHEKKILAEIERYVLRTDDPIDLSLIEKDRQVMFRQAIELLTPSVRAVFDRCYIAGKTHKVTAEELGISESTVNKHMIKATRLIKEYVQIHSGLLILLAGITVNT